MIAILGTEQVGRVLRMELEASVGSAKICLKEAQRADLNMDEGVRQVSNPSRLEWAQHGRIYLRGRGALDFVYNGVHVQDLCDPRRCDVCMLGQKRSS
mmetsp:Transcript_22720/g.29112  ORF Transcript_22720/g.29112 Transcript_22720/m.29112 type:complete len:98 (-) Transcript_22720:60-353(-)